MRHIVELHLDQVVRDWESLSAISFKPNQDFYDRIGITGKRFWGLMRNEAADVQIVEVWNLAAFFGCSVSDLYTVHPIREVTNG